MDYIHHYDSPLGWLTLAGDGECLVGLWMEGQNHFARGLDAQRRAARVPVFDAAERWLDVYFGGGVPDFTPPLYLRGTPFQRRVWEALLEIPYGQTTTYGALAERIAARMGVPRACARAVGGAVARNPIALIVPCHRVLGAGGRLTGYAGGLERKTWLLRLEGAVGQG